MATSVTMPQLGESVTEGTVTRWLKQVGDTVAMDEPLLEVSTDKVDTEIPSPAAGVLTAIRANEDDVVEADAVEGVEECEAALDFVRLDHGLLEVVHGERLARAREPVRDGEDGTKIVRGMTPLEKCQ